MISAIKSNKKKSFRVTFAPGTKTEEEQISNFVRAVENEGPGIDDLSKMIKSLPNKKINACQSKEAQSVSNMIVHLRKTLDNMLEKECGDSIINNNENTNNSCKLYLPSINTENSMKITTDYKILENPERRSSNSSISSVDSAIADCDNSSEFYKNFEINNCIDMKKNQTTDAPSPKTRQKVTNLLKELNTCIEELCEDNYSDDDTFSPNLSSSAILSNDFIPNDMTTTCVKDVFAAGILIASFIQISYSGLPLQSQYSVLSDNKIYMFQSNRSKSPLTYVFNFNNLSSIKKSKDNKNTLIVTGKYNGIYGETLANEVTLVFSSGEECNIWYKLLLNVISTNYLYLKETPTRKQSLNKHNNYQNDSKIDSFNPSQTILSALCVLENVEKSIMH